MQIQNKNFINPGKLFIFDIINKIYTKNKKYLPYRPCGLKTVIVNGMKSRPMDETEAVQGFDGVNRVSGTILKKNINLNVNTRFLSGLLTFGSRLVPKDETRKKVSARRSRRTDYS